MQFRLKSANMRSVLTSDALLGVILFSESGPEDRSPVKPSPALFKSYKVVNTSGYYIVIEELGLDGVSAHPHAIIPDMTHTKRRPYVS